MMELPVIMHVTGMQIIQGLIDHLIQALQLTSSNW